MKWLIKILIASTLSLWVTNQIFPQGLVLAPELINILKAGGALTIGNILLRPLLNTIMLPINLLTFGMFRWVVNVVILWGVAKYTGSIQIQAWDFNWWMAWLVVSFVVAATYGVIAWILD